MSPHPTSPLVSSAADRPSTFSLVMKNIGTALFIGVLIMFVSVIIIAYLMTGKICLFFNRACLN